MAIPDVPKQNRSIYVVNLFPNKAPIARNLLEIEQRVKNLQFANKTCEDLKLLRRFNEVAELMDAIENLPADNPLAGNPAYEAVRKRCYVQIPDIVAITPPEAVDFLGDTDFSPEAIQKRPKRGMLRPSRR